MQPGLTRAVPAAILGFLAACAAVIVIRSLQDLQPVFDTQVAFVLGAFVSAFTFVWGMGAVDPAMQQHPHEPEVDPETGLIVAEPHHDEHDEDEEAEEDSDPARLVGMSVWEVAFWTVVLFIVLFGFANLPTGLTMRTSSDPSAQLSDIGSSQWTIPVLGTETHLSQMTTFFIMVVAIMVGLLVLGGGLGMLMTRLNAGVKEVEQIDSTALPETPDKEAIAAATSELSAAEYIAFGGTAVVIFLLLYYAFVGVPISEPGWLRIGLSVIGAAVFAGNLTIRPALLNTIGEKALNVLLFVGLAGVLYVAFYYILIGVPLAGPPWLRISLSVINAVGAAFTVVYPKVLTGLIGKTAADVLKALRGLPAGLGNK